MIRFVTTFVMMAVWFVSATMVVAGEPSEEPLRIYIDADFSNHSESSMSIERGLNVALSNSGHRLLGRPIEIVRKDHRGNSARSLRHINAYLEDPNALLMVSGIHSPPLLAHRDYINEQSVLFLVPWAAAGPITRYPSKENWIFRLSVDDWKAADVIVEFAVIEKGYRRPFLLLERTGWGQSNERTLTEALHRHNIQAYQVGWFDWNLKKNGALALLERAYESRSDAIILVANAIEGRSIFQAIGERPQGKRLPVLSHWGITGGDFHRQVSSQLRDDVDLHFIQTSFSFLQPDLTELAEDVLSVATELYPEVVQPADILAPAGFIHAHDLGLLLIEATGSVEHGLKIEDTRDKLRLALENIDGKVEGLIKTYDQPFSAYSEENPDAHEALRGGDLAMGYYGTDDVIRLAGHRE